MNFKKITEMNNQVPVPYHEVQVLFETAIRRTDLNEWEDEFLENIEPCLKVLTAAQFEKLRQIANRDESLDFDCDTLEPNPYW